MDLTRTRGTDSASAFSSELQVPPNRHASQQELEECTKAQTQRVAAGSNSSDAATSPCSPPKLSSPHTIALPQVVFTSGTPPDAGHALGTELPSGLRYSPYPQTQPTGAGSRSALPNAQSTHTTKGIILPPVPSLAGCVTQEPRHRAAVETVLHELFTRAGPVGNVAQKKHAPRQLTVPTDTNNSNSNSNSSNNSNNNTTPVPPSSAMKKNGAVFTRRGLGNTVSTTVDSSGASFTTPRGAAAVSGPLHDDDAGRSSTNGKIPAHDGQLAAADVDAPPIPSPSQSAVTREVRPRELPQVLHAADIAARPGGVSSPRSTRANSSLGGSSALFAYMQAGSPVGTDSRRDSLFADGSESHLSDIRHSDPSRSAPGFRPGRSVLNVSEYLTAEENPILNGALPMFGSDEGPQFARIIFNRRVPVYVPVEETEAALAALNVPVIDDILTAKHEVNIVEYCLDVGLDKLFTYTSLNVLLRYGFVKRLGLDTKKLYNFLLAAATFFREGNPFHHPFHASDVIIAAHQWLAQPTAAAYLSDMEIFAFLFAAIVMRVGHCGVDNDFLAQLHHPFATVFGYSAPQQGATMALVIALLALPANHFLPPLSFSTARAPTTQPEAADVEGRPIDPVASRASAEANPYWTSSSEVEFLDMVSDLVLASDERNHAEHVANMAHICAEHFLQHGCVCLNRTREEKAALTTPCQSCCAYIEDKDVAPLLKAILHFVDFCFLFRPYPIFVSGACTHTAELYRQAASRTRLLDTITSAVEMQGTGAPLSAADAAVMKPRMVDDPSAQSKPWRPAMTRTSIVAMLRSHRQQDSRSKRTSPSAATDRTEMASMSLDTVSTAAATVVNNVDALLEDTAQLLEDTAQLLGPLRGYGRDLLLVGIETLFYPNLDATGPYLPKAWVAAFFANHQQLLEDNPSPVEYDAAIERVFRLGHCKKALSSENAEEAAKSAFYRATCYDDIDKCGLRVEPHWSLAGDATHVRRVLKMILTPLKPDYI